jgi:DNA-binding NtrC family response regulator
MDDRKKILLADDDFGMRFPLAMQLEDLGYGVISVADVAGVREHYEEADVLVLDARLPTGDLEGIEVAAELRKQQEQSRWKPIIFMSVHRPDECSEHLDTFPGAFDWLVKAFEIELLDRLIKRALAKQQTADASI